VTRSAELTVARRISLLACAVVGMTLAFGCRGDQATLVDRMHEARRLAAEMRVQLSMAADASNRAVMADTHEASTAFVGEAELATRALQKDAAALEPLLKSLRFSRELEALGDFEARFVDYQELDRKILKLAVENTNLKAQALSFGAANQAATSFRDALRPLAADAALEDRWRVEALVSQAVLAVREIQVLYAPHIAEHDDATMTRLEKEMADLDATARDALKSLDEAAPPKAAGALTAARSALDRLRATTAQIVELSRRNTNVISLDLALRQRPPLAAACDERLRNIQDALAKEGYQVTR
jgi:hypothetical protein